MKELLELISEFLSSDLVKNYKPEILASFALCIVVTVTIVLLIFNKIIIPYEISKNGDFQKKYENSLEQINELEKQNSRLRNQLEKYKRTEGMLKALDSHDEELTEDKGLSQFLDIDKTGI